MITGKCGDCSSTFYRFAKTKKNDVVESPKDDSNNIVVEKKSRVVKKKIENIETN